MYMSLVVCSLAGSGRTVTVGDGDADLHGGSRGGRAAAPAAAVLLDRLAHIMIER